MRAEGPKERPTTHSSIGSTVCWTAKSARAAPNMAQVERNFTTYFGVRSKTASSGY